MKKYAKLSVLLILAGALSVAAVSCSDDDDNDYYLCTYPANALVTVKPVGTDSCYLQLDNNTTLNPVNIVGGLFGGKEVRALTNFCYTDGYSGDARNVLINWIDSIRTKPMVPTLGDLNDEAYGDDPVEVVNEWVTIAEDGYLTLRVRVLSNGSGHVHYLNTGGYVDGIIAFNLGALPDTNGEIVKLTLKWRGYSADKSVTFDYCTRRSAGSVNTDAPINVQSLRLKVD